MRSFGLPTSAHYKDWLASNLTEQEKSDLVPFLESPTETTEKMESHMAAK